MDTGTVWSQSDGVGALPECPSTDTGETPGRDLQGSFQSETVGRNGCEHGFPESPRLSRICGQGQGCGHYGPGQAQGRDGA